MQFTELFISLDQPNQFILSPQNTDELSPIELVFESDATLRLRFYRDYEVVTLDSGSTITIALTEFNEWAPPDTLASEGTWTKTTSGDDTYYDGILDLGESNMLAYFGQSRESYRMANGVLTVQNGYGIIAIPFLAKILRSPAL